METTISTAVKALSSGCKCVGGMCSSCAYTILGGKIKNCSDIEYKKVVHTAIKKEAYKMVVSAVGTISVDTSEALKELFEIK